MKIEQEYIVHIVAFTHTAVSNISHCSPNGANTIQHFILSIIPKIKRDVASGKKIALVIDEASMIPMHFWVILAALKFLHVEFYIFGDWAGQFKPIFLEDQKWETMDSSDFLHDLCNGLKINFKKFRRGTDLDHFKFTTSIYHTDLESALKKAREKYPDKKTSVKTTLCVTNKFRKHINFMENRTEYKEHKHDGVFLECKSNLRKAQAMYVWPGLILQSCCSEKQSNKKFHYDLKNGLFYKIKKFDKETMTFIKLDKDMNDTIIEFSIPIDEVPAKLLLCYAYTYHKSQARTIKGTIRLAQTDHTYFSLRHLIVGLGRSPLGQDVQVA